MSIKKHTDVNDPVWDIASPFVARMGDDVFVLGSSAIIAPGIAITATHVFEEYQSRFAPKQSLRGTLDVAYQLQLISARQGGYWDVAEVYGNKLTDIVFLKIQPGNDMAKKMPVRKTRLSPLPPKISSQVTAFGFPRSKVLSNTDVHADLDLSPIESTGSVTDVYQIRRESALVTFPSFQVNTPYPGGMSGGPVFNDKMEICGVVSVGSNFQDESEDPLSYAASLWPSTGILFYENEQPETIYAMGKKRRLDIGSLERIILTPDGDGFRPSFKV